MNCFVEQIKIFHMCVFIDEYRHFLHKNVIGGGMLFVVVLCGANLSVCVVNIGVEFHEMAFIRVCLLRKF